MELQEVPKPTAPPGGVLVRVTHSVISPGTEKMKVEQAKMNLLQKAKARPDQVRAGEWLAASSAAGDSGFVAWGHAEVLHSSGLASPYPYLWSLPIRVRDNDLRLLVDTLRGADAPTWVVEWDSFGSWDLDDEGRLAEALDERYRLVAEVCGRDVYLLRGAVRELAEPPAC